jgi:transglutaminase-like putative cysteine protease
MLYRIYHETTYHYSEPVSDSYMEARLRPWSDADQGCAEYSLRVEPEARCSSLRTPFAWVEFFNVLAPHDTLRLVSEALVIAQPRNPFERVDLSGDWRRLEDEAFRGRFWEYLSPPGEADGGDPPVGSAAADLSVAEAARAMVLEVRQQTGDSVAAFVIELARTIHGAFAYDPRATTVGTPLVDVLAQRRGVCQDFSHLMLAVLRTAGVPARYVSGYLYVPEGQLAARAARADARVPGPLVARADGSSQANPLPPAESGEPRVPSSEPGSARFAPRPQGEEPTQGAMHAWVEAFLPGSGWVGVDPTHGLLVDHQYVKVGVGRDYDDVPPTRGLYRGQPEHTLTSRVRVSVLAQAEGQMRRSGLCQGVRG